MNIVTRNSKISASIILITILAIAGCIRRTQEVEPGDTGPVKIGEHGILYKGALNGKIVPLENFDAFLITEKKTSGSGTLVIKADVAAKHGTVLKLMKMAKAVNIETIGMAVDTETQ